MRCFVALTPPAEVREELALLAREVLVGAAGEGFRVLPAKAVHLTVLFLGELSEQEAGALGPLLNDRLEGTRGPRLRIEGLGAFPSSRQARVLWAGVAEVSGTPLERLHQEVSAAAGSTGWSPAAGHQGRGFRPHLTLARWKGCGRPPAIPAGVAPLSPSFDWRVDAIELMRSHLGREGARYERLQRVEFSNSDDSTRNPRS